MKPLSILMFALTLILPSTIQADPFGLPPGKWWRMPEVVERLSISTEQQDRLDELFRRSASELIDLKADMEKRAVELRGAMDRTRLDPKEIRELAAKLNDARGRLFERELMMLVEMRQVLSDEQWNRLRQALDQRRAAESRRGLERDRRPPPRRRP